MLFNALKTMYVYKSNEKLMTQDLCPSSRKIFQKSVISFFSFDLCTDIKLRQLNEIKNLQGFFVFFHFSFFSVVSRFVSPVVLPYCGPRCITPLHYPVVGSKSSSQPLRKLMTQDLCPSSKKQFKKTCDFHFFSFDLHTDIILKQLQK